MKKNWEPTYIDLENLINISRGDKQRMLKYLKQFQELIPQRIENVKQSLAKEDRKMIRQILHQMSPQLQFFGIPDVLRPIRRLEHDYDTIPMEELTAIVNDLLAKLKGANDDVEMILKNNF